MAGEKEKGILYTGMAYYFVRTYKKKRMNMLSAKLGENSARWLLLAKVLLAQYVVTGLVIVILSFVLLKWQASENIIQLAIIAIYVVATMFGGWLTGKKMENRRFMWGLAVGCIYFLLLTMISLMTGGDSIQVGNSFWTTLVLCAGGGMLGGMFS